MLVHNIDNWHIGSHGGLDIKTGNGAFDNQRADINDLIELVVYELEYQRHPIQEYSHDQYCERCQDPATYGCYVTNKKIGNRIRELRKQPTNAPIKIRHIK